MWELCRLSQSSLSSGPECSIHTQQHGPGIPGGQHELWNVYQEGRRMPKATHGGRRCAESAGEQHKWPLCRVQRLVYDRHSEGGSAQWAHATALGLLKLSALLLCHAQVSCDLHRYLHGLVFCRC